ncbi:MAG: hypothetical protein HN534_02445 [Euryarchaeota archaeon]|jgi:hypothetical protein|nr:hypothetical protein [Euryarchaeota archaeon]MBT5509373.1 hypothetical protein [Euryarchaeota archaeon]MBT6802619.1 hypothetical protein [Euryarchaeota archaeon]
MAWEYGMVETLNILEDESVFKWGFHVFDGEPNMDPAMEHTGTLNEVLHWAGKNSWEMVTHLDKSPQDPSYYSQLFYFKREFNEQSNQWVSA